MNGNVTGTANYIGGLLGYLGSGNVSANYMNGKVFCSGTSSYVGGLLGQLLCSSTAEVSESHMTGTVGIQGNSGSGSYFGGLIGYLQTSGTGKVEISGCTVEDSVTADSTNAFVGGLIGYNSVYTGGTQGIMIKEHVRKCKWCKFCRRIYRAKPEQCNRRGDQRFQLFFYREGYRYCECRRIRRV